MASPISQNGGIPEQSKFAPMHMDRAITGLWTQRSPLRDAATPYIYEKFYSAGRYDSLIGGQNAELTTRLTWARRLGNSVYNLQNFPRINRYYEFRQFTTDSESTSVIADTAAAVYDATGPITQTVIWNKSNGAGSTFFQSIGNILYFCNGVDQKKYLQTAAGWAVQNMGISLATNSNFVATPTAGANGGGAGSAWSNPSNVFAVPPNFATVNTSANAMSGPLTAGNGIPWGISIAPLFSGIESPQSGLLFGFAIPGGATIAGIMLSFTRRVSNVQLLARSNQVQMVKAGGGVGTPKSNAALWTTSAVVETYGSPTDLWGTTWTPTDVNANNFGFQVAADVQNLSSHSLFDAFGDSYTITIYYINGSGQLFSQSLNATATTVLPTLPASSPAVWTGVSVTFDAMSTGADLRVQLLINGNLVGTPKTITPVSGLTTYTLGAPGDLWGYGGLTSALIAGGSVGVSFIAQNGAALTSVDNASIFLWTISPPGVSPTGSGSLTTTNGGWKYVQCYGNSVDGHCSTAGPASVSTGNFSGKTFVGVGVTQSPDSQVNQIRVFRTVDGGDGVYLELPNSPFPNAGGTIQDTATDALLNFESLAPLDHANDPPPLGMINLEFHLQRIFGSFGNTVVWSSSPGATIGVGAQSFPPNNFAVFPSKVIKLKSSTLGLFVFTKSDIFMIYGSGTASDPFKPLPLVTNIGVLSYDAITVKGATVYLMQSNGKVMSLDPSAGTIEPGFPIGDQFLEQYNPASTFVTWHEGSTKDNALYVGDGSTGWYRMSELAAPEVAVPIWSPKANIVGGCGCVQSVQVASGDHRLLLQNANGGPILQRDQATNTDNGNPFEFDMIIGSIVLAQPGQIAEVAFITLDSMRVGTRPTVGLILDEVSGTFDLLTKVRQDPPLLPPSDSLFNDRYWLTQKQISAFCRHMQVQFSWQAEDVANELLTFTIFGALHTERQEA